MNNEGAIRNLFPGMKTLKTEMKSVKEDCIQMRAVRDSLPAEDG